MCYNIFMVNKYGPASEPERPDFLASFLDSIKKGIESLSILPSDLTAKINEAISDVGARFENRIKYNRAGLFTWVGVPAPEKLEELKHKLGRLEARLTSIENSIKALENHKAGDPWPQIPDKPRTTVKK